MWVYAFLNLETRATYIKIFQLVFKVLGNTTQSSIQFAHIHGTGLRTAIVNIYKKQASGKYMLYIYIAYAYNI